MSRRSVLSAPEATRSRAAFVVADAVTMAVYCCQSSEPSTATVAVP